MTDLRQHGIVASMTTRDWRIVAILFVVISSVYFATLAGITSSNDGSHYALVRALVDKHSFEISEYLSFTENQDYALNGLLRFSDRPPGTAALAAPVYALAQFLPPPLTTLESKHDSDNPRLLYALIVPVGAASATAIILFWILRAHFGLSEWSSIFTVLAFAFGTMTWKYGSLLYSHATSGLWVMAAVALLLRMQTGEVAQSAKTSQVFLGVVVGASVLMEYTNIVFVIWVGLYWLWQNFIPSPSHLRAPAQTKLIQLAFFLLGGLIPAALLMTYNTLNFGGPLELSTFHVDTTRWPQNTSFFHDFATPIWIGLPALLFWGSDNQGLFWLAPISLLGLFGLKPLWQKSPREFILIVGGFVAMLLLFSTSTTFNPFTNDGRYLTPFLGLWFVAVGWGVVRAIHELPLPELPLPELPLPELPLPELPLPELPLQVAPLRWAIMYGLLFLSIQNQILHIAYSWGHDLKPETLRPWAAAPENIVALWNAVLPNVYNLPLWWGLLAVGGVSWQILRNQNNVRR